jgi:hypothetical protein
VNPWGLVILSLGVILIIVAWHGSQSSVFGALKGIG